MTDQKPEVKRLRIGVMASGSGTTLQAVIDASESGALAADIVIVISNNSRSGAMARADRHGLPSAHLSSRTHPDPNQLDRAIARTLEAHSPDIVLLAGYMKKLGARTLATFRNRIVNTHPSLLPRHGGKGMYGGHVHAAVIAAGEKLTGISIHLVDSGYDTGRVLAQREVEVLEGDDAASLAARVQSIERPFLIEALQKIAEGRISLD
jgi:phosphoribosylglycinamide formyltransferase-1